MSIDRRRFLAAVCAALAPLPAAGAESRGTLREFYDRSFREQLQGDPTRATLLHFPAPNGTAHDSWTLRTDRWYDERAQIAKSNLERLKKLCVDAECGSDDALLYALSQRELIEEARWRRHHVPFFGALAPHVYAPSVLMQYHEIRSLCRCPGIRRKSAEHG